MCATLSWEQDRRDLYLRVDARRDRVPALVSLLLNRDGCRGMTHDPAADLLRLELDLRRYVRFLSTKAADAEEEMEYGRDSVTLAAGEVGRQERKHHRLAVEYLATAARLHMLWRERESHAAAWLRHVRQFVVDTVVPDGLLAEAAAGWRRGSERPTFVTVFDSTAAFVAADTRRADPEWWARRIDTPGGVVAGSWWRRDGDDDDRLNSPLPGTGQWQIAYLPQTSEVYAARRATWRPEEVWLLGSHWGGREVADVLGKLMKRMGEPNSLILVAQTLRSTQNRGMSMSRSTGPARQSAPQAKGVDYLPAAPKTALCPQHVLVTSTRDDTRGRELMTGVRRGTQDRRATTFGGARLGC